MFVVSSLSYSHGKALVTLLKNQLTSTRFTRVLPVVTNISQYIIIFPSGNYNLPVVMNISQIPMQLRCNPDSSPIDFHMERKMDIGRIKLVMKVS
jgi:hypothetical protein